jgi:hypothetical protein
MHVRLLAANHQSELDLVCALQDSNFHIPKVIHHPNTIGRFSDRLGQGQPVGLITLAPVS